MINVLLHLLAARAFVDRLGCLSDDLPPHCATSAATCALLALLHAPPAAPPLAQALAFLATAFTVTLSKVLLKRGRTWLPKRTIMKGLFALRGFGPYTTSVFWQYYRLAVRYPAAADLAFAACGPGCRPGINWLFGHPPDLCCKEA